MSQRKTRVNAATPDPTGPGADDGRNKGPSPVTGAEEQVRLHLAAIVENSEDAILSKTLEGVITSWNAATERLYGYSRAEAIGQPMSLIVPPDRADELASILLRAGRGETVPAFDTVRIRKDGTPVEVSIRVSPIRAADGTVVGASTIARDVRDRKQAEAALRRSEERFSKAFAASPDSLVISREADNVILEANRSFFRLFGLEREEALGKTSTDLNLYADPADRERARQVLREQGYLHDLPMRIRRPSGEIRTVLISAERMETEEAPAILSVLRDVTEQKRTEEERRHVLTSARCLLWSADVRGLSDAGFVDCDTWFPDPEAAERFLPIARQADQPFYQDWYRARLPEDSRECDHRGVEALRAGRDYSQEFRIRLADGSLRWVHEDVKVEVAEAGHHWRLVGVCTDITERKRVEEELRQLHAESETRSLTLETANRVAADILVSRTGVEALHHIADAARALAGARYAALGVTRPGTTELLEFVTVGLTPQEEAAIGARPEGRGVLGVLLQRREPLHLNALGAHPAAVGFPPHHPPMATFLGVPILRGETVLGSLYLTDKEGGGKFTEADEVAVQALGAFAAVAIQNLHALNRQRAMVSGLINAQEAERKAVAYDLHDGLTQYVMASHAHLESYLRASQAGREERAAKDIEQGLRYLKEAVVESRRLVNGLRTLMLDDVGLVGALEHLVTEEKSRAGWGEAVFDHDLPTDARYDDTLQTAIYRVAQEALTNARKYAQTARVSVSLRGATEPHTGHPLLILEVRDWGQGFVVEDKLQERGRVGLHSMSERVSLLGGACQVRSAPGEGTYIRASFPVLDTAIK